MTSQPEHITADIGAVLLNAGARPDVDTTSFGDRSREEAELAHAGQPADVDRLRVLLAEAQCSELDPLDRVDWALARDRILEWMGEPNGRPEPKLRDLDLDLSLAFV